jgi:hypothetical protein
MLRQFMTAVGAKVMWRALTKLLMVAGLVGVWRVDIRGKELQNLGTVDAPNAWEALAKAVDLFDIRPALRSKTVVTKLEEPEPSSLR